MTFDTSLDAASDDPRPVSRGSEIHLGFLGLDSLYLVLEYPSPDVFQFWRGFVQDLSNPRLHTGIPVDDFLIRKGNLGYSLSVWDGDARLFLTDRVDDVLPDDERGMGMMLQLGPKWLRQYGKEQYHKSLIKNAYAQFEIFGVREADKYPARLNRLDIALDVVGLRLEDFSIDEWRSGWVGYARRKNFFDSALTGKLEGFAIGSSSGGVRFKVYDKVAESLKSGTLGFWRSVWAADPDAPVTDVARFEWSIKPYQAKFAGLRYLNDFTGAGFLDLLNYVTLKWGRLCIPEADSNRARWELAPIWKTLRAFIDNYSVDYDGFAQREYDFRPDLNPHYLKSVNGWIGGLLARIGVAHELGSPSSLSDAFELLYENGLNLHQKAQEKWEIFARLAAVQMGADDE